jgi:hypothetical protein
MQSKLPFHNQTSQNNISSFIISHICVMTVNHFHETRAKVTGRHDDFPQHFMYTNVCHTGYAQKPCKKITDTAKTGA